MIVRICLMSVVFLLVCVSKINAQEDRIAWSTDYQLTVGDFKNPQTEIGGTKRNTMVQSGALVEIGFAMNGIQFMFTKNFNEKVQCLFDRKSAFLIAPDTTNANKLVKLSQFDFDLSELYARKIRKELFENKKAFSKANFFEPYFQKMIQERNGESARIYKASEFGTKETVLRDEHQKVLKEIEALDEYCFSCKPSKRPKKKG